MSSETADLNNTEAPELLPGAELKAQREAAGHDLMAIATATRITRSKLAALEADDYEKLGGNTFVIGYIRQYAKWLGVDADPLVQAFERIVGEAPRAERDHQVQQESATGQEYFWKTYAESDNWLLKNSVSLLWVAAAILALVFLVSVVSKDTGKESPVATENHDSAAEVAETPDVDVSPEASLGGVESDQALGETAPTETSDTAPAEDRADLAADEAPLPVEAIPNEDIPAPAETIEPESVAQADSATPEPVGTDQLAMSFTGPCWVEVTDANGDLHVARLLEASDNLQVTGTAPFEIMLGNARAVTLLVNGRVVNTNPGPNRDTLRLTVGP